MVGAMTHGSEGPACGPPVRTTWCSDNFRTTARCGAVGERCPDHSTVSSRLSLWMRSTPVFSSERSKSPPDTRTPGPRRSMTDRANFDRHADPQNPTSSDSRPPSTQRRPAPRVGSGRPRQLAVWATRCLLGRIPGELERNVPHAVASNAPLVSLQEERLCGVCECASSQTLLQQHGARTCERRCVVREDQLPSILDVEPLCSYRCGDHRNPVGECFEDLDSRPAAVTDRHRHDVSSDELGMHFGHSPYDRDRTT